MCVWGGEGGGGGGGSGVGTGEGDALGVGFGLGDEVGTTPGIETISKIGKNPRKRKSPTRTAIIAIKTRIIFLDDIYIVASTAYLDSE